MDSKIKRGLEKLRPQKRWTPEIDKILLAGRKEPAISFANLANYIEERYKIIIPASTLNNRWQRLQRKTKSTDKLR